MADIPRLKDREIVCVGFADWDTDLWTNQHHLMSRLASENRVLFIESLGLRRPRLAGRDLRRIWRRLRAGLRGPREADGLYVLSPLVLPLHSNRLVRALNARLLGVLVKRATRRLAFGRPILWSYVPQAESLVEVLDPRLVVYHCVDDIAAQPGIDATSFSEAEQRFAARADLVLASAPALAERLGAVSTNVIYAPNVADTDLFSHALRAGPLDAAMASLRPPRVVFIGAIVTTKLDLPLIVELARARPKWSFAMVGPIGPGDPRADVSALRAEPNIHLLGARPYQELPSVLRAADAGFIPYALNELTGSIFPMKVYEYLAAGMPVVATPLPALAGVEAIATASDAPGLARLLDGALTEDSQARRAERSRLASAHSWDRRLLEIAGAIDAIERQSSAAIPPSKESWDLLVSTHTPQVGSGRAMRTYGLAQALATGGRLKLLYVLFGSSRPDPAFAAAGIELHEVRPSRGARRLMAYAKARLEGVPRDFARGVSPEMAAAAKRLAREEGCARVIADGPTAAATLLALARIRPVIYNAHNLESSFRHELDSNDGLHGLASFERKLLSRASESWMVSTPDMIAAHELCPSANLRLVPNVVDVAAITPVSPPAQEQRALFVANFSYEPNRNALRFLLREVMPLVWEQLPQAHLTLVGGGLRDALESEGLSGTASDTRVQALGFVADLSDAYRHARCVVVPLLQGGGTPLKLLEALAYGLPTVTTPRAAQALGLRDGEDCLFADGARPFANALVHVLRVGAPELGAAARKVAEERYSVQALARALNS
ncbi:MAG TPA: glycosyltransferase [Solirubrobacteraceae bacterium]|jgi:glycosyltransferase involved in cell wall biosynthesis